MLLVRGEAGIGKSALLDYLARNADGCSVARASGVESDMELPFAGLHQLCTPLLDLADRLPHLQQEALEVAFGVRAGAPPDRFVVGAATLTLLSEASADRPLLCIVDDAQWLDQASAQALDLVRRVPPDDEAGLRRPHPRGGDRRPRARPVRGPPRGGLQEREGRPEERRTARRPAGEDHRVPLTMPTDIAPAVRVVRPIVRLAPVQAQFQAGGTKALADVKTIQLALNARLKINLLVDGKAGRFTKDAYKKHQKAIGSAPKFIDGIPGPKDLANLGRGRFGVV